MNRNRVFFGAAAAAAALFAGFAGVPASTLVLLVIVGACPLAMFVMMRMMGGPNRSAERDDALPPLTEEDRDAVRRLRELLERRPPQGRPPGGPRPPHGDAGQ